MANQDAAEIRSRNDRIHCAIQHNKKTGVRLSGSAVRAVKMARLEAVLLIAREPLATRKLSQLASLADGTEARTLIRQLGKLYDQQGSAFCVEEVAGGYQLMTRPKFAGWLRRLFQRPDTTRLSTPALETLSVVAYRQPVLRADIESIRGVGCGEILRQLMECDLVKITGRSEELGRPFLYGTSKQFLLAFGLRHLDELPRAEQLRGTGIDRSTHAHEQDTEELKVSEMTTEQDTKELKVSAMTTEQLLPTDEMEELQAAEMETVDQDVDENPLADLRQETETDDEAIDDDEEDEFDDDDDDGDDDIEEGEWEEVDDEEMTDDDAEDDAAYEVDDDEEDDFEYEEDEPME